MRNPGKQDGGFRQPASAQSIDGSFDRPPYIDALRLACWKAHAGCDRSCRSLPRDSSHSRVIYTAGTRPHRIQTGLPDYFPARGRNAGYSFPGALPDDKKRFLVQSAVLLPEASDWWSRDGTACKLPSVSLEKDARG